MNRKEFDQWFKHFVSAFPAANAHVCSVDPTGRETLGHWFAVLEKRSLADALAVTNGIFSGDLAGFADSKGYIDWSAVPRHVSRLCAEMHPVEPGWKQEVKRKQTGQGIIKDDPQMAAAYADALEILEGGGTMTDVRAMLLLRFPSGAVTHYREDEYQEI